MRNHKYQLPARVDSFADEVRIMFSICRLLLMCDQLMGKAVMSVEDMQELYRQITDAYQQVLDLGLHPMRLFRLTQIERDLRVKAQWLWSMIPTEWEHQRVAVLQHYTLPTPEMAAMCTVPLVAEKKK